MARLEQVNVRFPRDVMARIEMLIEGGKYVNRQELIRDAVRRLLDQLERESYTGP